MSLNPVPFFEMFTCCRDGGSLEVLLENTVVKWGENPIITLSDGNTLSFTKIEREIGGKKLYEIRATDITKQYALNLELQRNNNELRSLNTRLQEYGENVYDITREREILTAKVNIHDMLGKALLVTKRYIECKETNITKEELKELWQGTLYQTCLQVLPQNEH